MLRIYQPTLAEPFTAYCVLEVMKRGASAYQILMLCFACSMPSFARFALTEYPLGDRDLRLECLMPS